MKAKATKNRVLVSFSWLKMKKNEGVPIIAGAKNPIVSNISILSLFDDEEGPGRPHDLEQTRRED